jgi:septum formation protein
VHGRFCKVTPTIVSNTLNPFIYLASQSPRRQELLKQIGVRYEMLLPAANEDAESIEIPLSNESAHTYVERVTKAKCQAALKRWKKNDLPWAPILCADTTVSLPGHSEGEILGKPTNAEDAVRILSMLSGKVHEVITGVAVISTPQEPPLFALQVSEVKFAALTKEQMNTYIASGEPFGKAGAYGIQGLASAFICSIKGSYSGIMGLPLYETAQLLARAQFHCI